MKYKKEILLLLISSSITIILSVLLANSKFMSEDNLQNLVVKIDVDGPEMEVFSGICDLLETRRKVSLMIEIQEENYAEVSKMLVDKGFTKKEPDYFAKSDVNTFWEKGS